MLTQVGADVEITYGSDDLPVLNGVDLAEWQAATGPNGDDRLSYAASSAAVFINMPGGLASGGDAEGDTILNIEGLVGSVFGDIIEGGAASETIWGGAGVDSLVGGVGNDTIFGGDGDDTIMGSAGHDQIDGGAGTDTVDYSGSDAGVSIKMNQGAFTGGHATGDMIENIEAFVGSAFADTIDGGDGNDSLVGGKGNDTIFGGDGDDFIEGSKQNNALYGDAGNDTISTGQHTSVADGGSGDDLIVARLQKSVSHTLTGGSGADVFEFVYPSGNTQAGATITDFEDGIDLLKLSGVASLADVTLSNIADGLIIDFNDDEEIMLTGIDESMITADDFIF